MTESLFSEDAGLHLYQKRGSLSVTFCEFSELLKNTFKEHQRTSVSDSQKLCQLNIEDVEKKKTTKNPK